jgi:2-methylcitrate dehydratase
MASSPAQTTPEPTVDPIQDTIALAAVPFEFSDIPEETVHAAKKRILDCLAGIYPALSAEPSVVVRDVAARHYPWGPSTILGTDQRTTIDMAAFVNATTARFAELNDALHVPGSPGGHPSDIITPLLAVAEAEKSPGADLITAVVLGYEVYVSMAETTSLHNWDATNWASLATAVGTGKLLGFDLMQFRDAISVVLIPNNALRRARRGNLSMWKAAAAGQAGRAGVFAALLVDSGMTGPTLPFIGKTGWHDAVGQGTPSALPRFATGERPLRLHRSMLKPRAACGTAIASVLAAERVFDRDRDPLAIQRVLVETYGDAKAKLGTYAHHWNPTTRESADHSIPYAVAAALVDGIVGPDQFDAEHLADKRIRHVMSTVEVVEDHRFTTDYLQPPNLHRTRVTVETAAGAATAEVGGEHGEIGDEMSDADADAKFVSLTTGHLGKQRSEDLLALLWNLDAVADASTIPPMLVPRA